VNVTVGRFEVDLLWRAADLVVELDGFRHHGTRSAFERDRARDVELRLLGYEVLRFTYHQVRDAPGEVAAALRALLERRGRMGR
jgi:very-short-patch-repair endonuclease